MSQTLLLGTNRFTDNNGTIIVNGVELFRLWEQQGNEQLVADFEVRAPDDTVIAKVHRNNFVHAVEGLTINHGPHFSEVADSNGNIIARAEEVSIGVVRVKGTFYADGHYIMADDEVLVLDGSEFRGCTSSCNGGGGIGIG